VYVLLCATYYKIYSLKQILQHNVACFDDVKKREYYADIFSCKPIKSQKCIPAGIIAHRGVWNGLSPAHHTEIGSFFQN
jgi:hypothetical protein